MIGLRCPSMRMWAWGVALAVATPLTAAEPEAAGVVRIVKSSTPTVRGQSEVLSAHCRTDAQGSPVCLTGSGSAGGCRSYYRTDWRTTDWSGRPFHQRTQAHSLAIESMIGKSPSLYYHDPSGQDMINYFRCKFGYFIPTGNGGAGTPPFGWYSRVYPEDPNYFDQRDGQMWAAQGLGAPTAVPLAPVVSHQWNYGWGTPSSRLTPVSRIAPY
jgi:hypothetical protein